MSSIGIGVPQGSPPMMLALLQAAPLVHGGVAVDQLDLKHERDIVLGALRRTGKRATVVTDFCTTRRLRDLLTDGCRILHYSGHGFSFVDRNGVAQARLAFENGEGGTHVLEVQNLTDLVAAGADGDGAPPLDFAFISACHSVGGGEAFVAAGVPHVVAVRREAQLQVLSTPSHTHPTPTSHRAPLVLLPTPSHPHTLHPTPPTPYTRQDRAACMFAEAFYYALFKGRTVRQAFDIGREAVKSQPHILRAGTRTLCICMVAYMGHTWDMGMGHGHGVCARCAWCLHAGSRTQPRILRAGAESDKFLLLPEHGDHAVALCKALPEGPNRNPNRNPNPDPNPNPNPNLYKALPEGPLCDLSPTPCAHNLPAFFPLQYVGRQSEVQPLVAKPELEPKPKPQPKPQPNPDQVQQLVAAAVGQQKRLLSLVGAAGVGKTSLALAAAHYLYERSLFAGGVFFVSVAGASSAAELTAAIFGALAEAGCGCGGSELELHAELRKRGPCLLLIDNWELLQAQPGQGGQGGAGGAGGVGGAGGAHAAAESATLPLLQALLQRAPELRLLVTATAPVTALPGVAQRQLLLGPMAAEQA